MPTVIDDCVWMQAQLLCPGDMLADGRTVTEVTLFDRYARVQTNSDPLLVPRARLLQLRMAVTD